MNNFFHYSSGLHHRFTRWCYANVQKANINIKIFRVYNKKVLTQGSYFLTLWCPVLNQHRMTILPYGIPWRAWFSRQLQPLVATAPLHSPRWKQRRMKPVILANIARAERSTTHVNVNLQRLPPRDFSRQKSGLARKSSAAAYGHCVQRPRL